MVIVSKGALIDLASEFAVGAEYISPSQARVGNSGPNTGVLQGGFIFAIGY
jgi:hypothetical protein